jgi:hypothetical protein
MRQDRLSMGMSTEVVEMPIAPVRSNSSPAGDRDVVMEGRVDIRNHRLLASTSSADVR